MSTPKQHITFQVAELNKLDEQLAMLGFWGVPESDPGFQRLFAARGAASYKIGLNLPRTTTLVSSLFGLSPGEIRLWADAELGWVAEARAEPGAPLIRHHVTNEEARAIIKREVSPELHDRLFTPDTYIGE